MPTDVSGKKKKQSKRKPDGWKQFDGRKLSRPGLWHPGEPLTEEDEKLLEPVKQAYRKLGYVPAKHEVKNKGPIKERFRVWNDVILAAGLPRYNDPDEMRKRMAIQEARKQEVFASGARFSPTDAKPGGMKREDVVVIKKGP